MSNFYSSVYQKAALWAPPLVAAIAILGASVGHAAVSECQAIFQGHSPVWPPADLRSYLEKVPMPDMTRPLVEYFAVKDIPTPQIYDARFFQMHKFTNLFPPDSMSHENPLPELNSAASDFDFIGTFTRDPIKLRRYYGPFGTFLILRSKVSGRELTIPGGLTRPKGIRKRDFLRSLNSYLHGVEQVVDTDTRNAEFDYFFSILESPEELARLEGMLNDEPWSQSSRSKDEAQTETRVTAVYEKGDTERVAVRETFRRGRYWIKTVDSHIRRRRLEKGGHPVHSLEELNKARETQRAWLNEVVMLLYPEYIGRRKWTKGFIDHDYEEVLASADRTRYILVYEDKNGEPGDVVATIGLNRAPYSSFSRLISGSQWHRAMAAFGLPFLQDFTNFGYMEIGQKERIPIHELPVLKMEKYLGLHLDRPTAIHKVQWDVPASVQNKRVVVNWPTLDGDGVLYEPVKFYLSSKAKHGEALTELVSVMAESIFPDHYDPLFALSGQALATFNPPREGTLLYAKRGYRIDEQYKTVNKDGVDWSVFTQSPYDFIMKFHKLSPADQQTAAGNFIESLRTTVKALSKPPTAQ